MFTYKEFQSYQNSAGMSHVFPWIKEFEQWLTIHYGITFLPSVCKITKHPYTKNILYSIHPVVMHQSEAIHIYSRTQIDGMKLELGVMSEKAKYFMQRYLQSENNEKESVRVLHCYIYEDLFRELYLLREMGSKLHNEILNCFAEFYPEYVYRGKHIVCVFKTPEVAQQFIESGNLASTQKKIMDKLKPYDTLQVLSADDISILVDFQDHQQLFGQEYIKWIESLSTIEVQQYLHMLLEKN